MLISYNNETLSIYFRDGELSKSQVNQVRYYGFTYDDNKNCFVLQNDDNIITKAYKLISFFNKQSITYELSDNLHKMISRELQNQEAFAMIKSEAKDFKNGIFNQNKFDEFCSFVNRNVKRKLKPHQIKAAYHHYLVQNAANFSVPGSGKTSTLITVYEKLKQEKSVNVMLVVGPLSSFTAWKDEFKHTLEREIKISTLSSLKKQNRISTYFKKHENIDLFLTTFQTFSNDYNDIKNFFIYNDVFLVIDEAHYIKQIGGKWSSAIINVSKKAKVKYILTGTPCPKSYSDLFNLFDFLWGQDKAITEKEKTQINLYEKNDDYKSAQKIIRENLDPLFYRVRKAELGLTAPIFHDPITVEMNPIERQIYDRIYKRISELSHLDDEKNIMTLLNLRRGRIIRLRQAISYTKLLKTAIEDYDENLLDDMNDISNLIVNYDKYELPAKLVMTIELVKDIQRKDKKIVIWTNFIETIALLERNITEAGMLCAHITGSTPATENEKNILTREKIIREFLTEGSTIDILIANPAACAESISLHKTCYHAIYYDLSYNCSQYLQSLDRIHRVGGSELHEANYYFMQYQDTIDNDIMNNLINKRNKMYDVIEYDSDIYSLDISPFTDDNEEQNAYNRIFKK